MATEIKVPTLGESVTTATVARWMKQAGDTVAVFPEGTTGAGPELLPFHANLLQASIATATPIQPVALRFSDESGRFSRSVEFLGATTLLQSVWRVALGRRLVAHVELLPATATAHADRRAMADYLRGQIQGAVDAAA